LKVGTTIQALVHSLSENKASSPLVSAWQTESVSLQVRFRFKVFKAVSAERGRLGCGASSVVRTL